MRACLWQNSMVDVKGGVTAPLGFTSAAVHCGIKPKAGALDLAVIAADRPASAAGLFTTNLAKAAPVIVSREHLERSGGTARALVVNSGCANACTGETGLRDAHRMAHIVAESLGCEDHDVLVASTGVIGVALPIARVATGIREAMGRLRPDDGANAALAIMTTDPF